MLWRQATGLIRKGVNGMKKIFLILVLFFGFTISVFSESIKAKIEGSEDSYNQMRITNNTKFTDFDCTVYLLEEKNGKFLIKETLGVFHLKDSNDTDSCTMKIKKNSYVGLSFPENIGELSYTISYKDLPFFDVVEFSLSDKTSNTYGDDPVGKEF